MYSDGWLPLPHDILGQHPERLAVDRAPFADEHITIVIDDLGVPGHAVGHGQIVHGAPSDSNAARSTERTGAVRLFGRFAGVGVTWSPEVRLISGDCNSDNADDRETYYMPRRERERPRHTVGATVHEPVSR
jgi:hypothetical protein